MSQMVSIQEKHRKRSNLLPENIDASQKILKLSICIKIQTVLQSRLFLNIGICFIFFYLFINSVASLCYFSQFFLRQWREAAISSVDLF